MKYLIFPLLACFVLFDCSFLVFTYFGVEPVPSLIFSALISQIILLVILMRDRFGD